MFVRKKNMFVLNIEKLICESEYTEKYIFLNFGMELVPKMH